MTEKFHLHAEAILKPGINDPQGNTIKDALHQLGFTEVEDVRTGHYIDADIDAKNSDDAVQKLIDPKAKEDFPTLGSRVLNLYSATLSQKDNE